MLIQEDQSVECLGLSAGCDMSFGCQMIQECRDIARGQFKRMLLAVVKDELLDPEPIGFLGSFTEVAASAGGMNLLD